MLKVKPEAQGLYCPEFEHDNCGIGFVTNIKGKKSHNIVCQGLKVLENMAHRGAESADNITGDGAGILIQVPHDFIVSQGVNVNEAGTYGTGIVFLPQKSTSINECKNILNKSIEETGLKLISYRKVPVNNNILGKIAKAVEPVMEQIFVTGDFDQDVLERKLYLARKIAEKTIRESTIEQKEFFYLPSLSSKVLIYKGMFTSEQLGQYFQDLSDTHVRSAIALVHSRFSTNTFPTWDLAQPFRMISHNGEINTIKGNRLWFEARESLLKSELFGVDIEKLFPIIEPNKSDSASIDNAFEFLFMSGKTLPHALAMLIPESWNDTNPIPDNLKAFYEYHSTIMEPWDGPASIIFSDGRYIGGILDRNGLRPSRYIITKDDLMVMGSEVGVMVFPPEDIVEKGRLKPGKILMIDTEKGTIKYDAELKEELASAYPYRTWLNENRIHLDDISSGKTNVISLGNELKTYTNTFNYTKEEIEVLIGPMAINGQEPIHSMGNDVPLAVLSEKPQRLFSYFKQLFAQVTNPPIDPIRENMVMSTSGYLGSLQKNLLKEIPEHVKMVKFNSPIITNTQLDILKNIKYKGFKSATILMHFDSSKGEKGLEEAINEICRQAVKSVDEGNNYLILSDKGISKDKAPIPVLLAVSAVHHFLIKERKRLQTGMIIETGDAREVMHFALLFGYGATVINPYLVFSVIENLVKSKEIQVDYNKAQTNYINAINKGLLKILSKMGISTLRSYRASQIFECVGINEKVVDKYFIGTYTPIGGIGMKEITEEVLISHRKAFAVQETDSTFVNTGVFTFRHKGEHHGWNPETIALLQWATHTNNYEKYKEFSKKVKENNLKPGFIRGYFDLKRNPIDISEVEPVENILKRFVTGAMSYGSISKEAHEAMAIAMNHIGGRSNTGEGGENVERFTIGADGLNKRSAIKQVASGRFGVTNNYLVNSDEIQIKMAQGAKPGEGGQLPGYKVDEQIAKTRYSIPGITLISPPPHHDIYSIEDLKQLIFDLKNTNPKANISVKLVSEVGVGTVAAGVAKASADLITISGMEGGTGASPLSSIKHTGLPIELGISEAQQTLVLNNLRERVILQADGQLKTGRDVVLMGILGADEFGFATAALISLGCVMMRKCHLNTCPVGIATQRKELREKFLGNYKYVVNLFTFIAQEVRELLAEMGYKSFDEIIGRTELITINKSIGNWKSKSLDFSKILYSPKEADINGRYHKCSQQHDIDNILDRTLIEKCQPAIQKQEKVSLEFDIKNTNRTVGAMLSGEISRKFGEEALTDNTINIHFNGSAGQSFGAFLVKGIEFKIIGESNDYIGKGLSGGRIIVVNPEKITYKPDENIIIGNVALYGATRGELYVNGKAGERFCIRNSGAVAIAEGVGDHCCEYMTGGRTVVLGKTGRNFAAGMSGGIAYVLDEDGKFDYYCNMGMVELSLVENSSDIIELKDIISKHLKYTKSKKAKHILDNWNDYLLKFIKIIPFEYKQILAEQKIEETKRKLELVDRSLQ